MPTESDLRELFGEHERGNGGIDADAVIRLARSRRRPKQVLAGGVGALAAVGVIALGASGFRGVGVATDSSSVAGVVPGAAPAPEKSGPTTDSTSPGTSKCGGAVPKPDAAASDGLTLTVSFPNSTRAGETSVEGSATLTNTGTSKIDGSASPFAFVTVSQDGVVVWHSNGSIPDLAQIVSLAPGESTSFDAAFDALHCSPSDDVGTNFPADVPALATGRYDVSASTVVNVDGRAIVVISPTRQIVVR